MRTVAVRTSLLAAVLLLAAGCGATPGAGQVTLEGTLVLRGNEPHVVPVLVRGPSEHWELQQVPRASAGALQNRKVLATGVVVRAPGSGFQLPALRVTSLQPAR